MELLDTDGNVNKTLQESGRTRRSQQFNAIASLPRVRDDEKG